MNEDNFRLSTVIEQVRDKMIARTRKCWMLCVWSAVLLLISTEDSSFAQNPISSTEDQALSYFYQRPDYPRDCADVQRQCHSKDVSSVYSIKPDGYPVVFDAYCDDDGYTVISRRSNGIIGYDRSWGDYTSGFGFLSDEFWIGNQRLSYLTNQRGYELRIEVTFTDGSTLNATYEEFRISDAHSNYALINTGRFSVEGGYCYWDSWTACSVTCDEGVKRRNCHCTDGTACTGVTVEEAACHEVGCPVDGGWSSWTDWTQCSVTCGGGQQERERECNRPAPEHGGQNCVGERREDQRCGTDPCQVILSDCKDVHDSGETSSGLYYINPTWSQNRIQVYCNMADGGGWTVIQRQDGTGNFYRNWADYKNGFGSPDRGTWLGNDKIYHLTSQAGYVLRIDLTDKNGRQFYATYSSFQINDESDKYRLSSVGTYSGNAGYSYLHYHVGKQFSTYDQDNDGWSSYNCAEQHRGGWWFYNRYSYYCYSGEYYCEYFQDGSRCHTCGIIHLNANYNSGIRGKNIFWDDLSGYDCGIQYTEMRIRPA